VACEKRTHSAIPAAQVTARDVVGDGYVACVGERLRTTAAQHPGRALGVLAAVAVLGTALAAGWTDRLALSSADANGAALRIDVRGELPASSATFRVAVRTMRAQLGADPAVRALRERRPSGITNSTLLLVGFDVGGQGRDAAIARIERNLDPGPLTAAFGGATVTVRAARDDALDDLVLILLALPLVALIAAATLGVRPAGAALVAAAAAAALASLGCELMALVIDLYWLALVGASAGGALLTLQLCALLRAGAGPAALWGSGLAAAGAFGAIAALGVGYLTSIGVGGALGALLAVPASLIAIGATGGLGGSGDGGVASKPWRAIADLVAWSRPAAGTFALLVIALLLIAAVPADRVATAAIGASAPPAIGAGELALAIGIAVAITALLGWALCKRAGLALATTLMAAIPAIAIAGLLVVSFQDGNLEGPLDYNSTGALQLGSVVAAVSVVGALCASQAVALAWAAGQVEVREPGAEPVMEAMGRCGPAIAVACLTGAAAGIALGFASPGFVKEFGLGMAAGMVIELLIVQALLAPALLRLRPGEVRHQ
jgi:hypothetical protein